MGFSKKVQKHIMKLEKKGIYPSPYLVTHKVNQIVGTQVIGEAGMEVIKDGQFAHPIVINKATNRPFSIMNYSDYCHSASKLNTP